MYKFVIFDLDGTLLNTLGDLASSGNWVCEQMGWPTHPLDAYRYFVGSGIPNLVWRFAPKGISEADHARALALYDEYYAAHKTDTTAPYPGVAGLLEELRQRGVRYGVVTNKDHRAAVEMVRFYFGSAIPSVQGRVDGVPIKPAPGTTLRLMETLGADPAATLFVGDSNVDIATARAAGLAGCGVLWGFRTRKELEEAGADWIAPDIPALRRIILGE